MNLTSLTKISYTTSIEDIKNRTDHLLDITPNISDNFDYKDFEMYQKIKWNIQKIEKIKKEKNIQKKVDQSRTLKILTSIHNRRELDYGYTCHGSITWDMWDKYIDIIKILHKDIKWEKYSELDLILCVFLWCSNAGPNYYNKNIKKKNDLEQEQEIEVPNMRPGRFGTIEFFITIDGYIKNSLKIPIDLLKEINENTYYNFFADTLKYVEKNKLTLLKQKYKNSAEVNGLKPDDYDDFCRINYPGKKKRSQKDWVEYYREKGYLEKYI